MARELDYCPASLPEGGHVSVLLPTGEVWIGRCRYALPDLLVLELWGGGVRQFPVVPGMQAEVIQQHSYSSTVAVTRNQRAGVPARVDHAYAAKLARQAERERRKTAEHQAQKLARAQARIQARKNRAEGNQHEA